MRFSEQNSPDCPHSTCTTINIARSTGQNCIPPPSFHLGRTQIALSAEVSTFEWRSSSSAAIKRGSARSVHSSTYITPLSRDAKFVCLGPSMPRLLSHAQLLYKVLESARKPLMALVTAQAPLSRPLISSSFVSSVYYLLEEPNVESA